MLFTWLDKKLDRAAGQKWKNRNQQSSPAPTASRPQGFAEAAAAGLRDLEARIPPPDANVRPAYAPSHKKTERLSDRAAAGGGLVRDEFGNDRPHYHGHRARLRTRFLAGGHQAMPEYELLELLLFNAIPRIDVKPLAKRLLATFGDLNGVIAASEYRIMKVDGATPQVFLQLRIAEALAQRMGQAKIMKRDIVSSWDDLISYCRTSMAHRETEQFRILYLDRKNTLIADEQQGAGTVDHVPVYPREVAKRALELNASAIILVHNHPSGDPTPSREDIEMTRQISDACAAIGVTIHDHVVIGKEAEVSFRSEGYL